MESNYEKLLRDYKNDVLDERDMIYLTYNSEQILSIKAMHIYKTTIIISPDCEYAVVSIDGEGTNFYKKTILITELTAHIEHGVEHGVEHITTYLQEYQFHYLDHEIQNINFATIYCNYLFDGTLIDSYSICES